MQNCGADALETNRPGGRDDLPPGRFLFLTSRSGGVNLSDGHVVVPQLPVVNCRAGDVDAAVQVRLQVHVPARLGRGVQDRLALPTFEGERWLAVRSQR